jgi:hypothetical protein
MPYQTDAIAKRWNTVRGADQVLISALMTVGGGGWFTAGVVLLLLLAFPFWNDRRWAVWAIPAVLCYSTFQTCRRHSHGPKPHLGTSRGKVNVFACLSAMIGFDLYHKPLEI